MKDRLKVLITGAAGLLGSHLADAFLTTGCRVTGIDNLSLGSLSNLSDAQKHENFQFINADVCDLAGIEKQLERHDAIVHMAAYKIEVPGLLGTDILEINSIGTMAMLKKAAEWDSLFVFASTSDVYGKNSHAPFSERHDLVMGPSDGLRWGYASSKIFDEHLCYAYRRRYGLKTIIIRYFNTYGPRHELTPRSGGPQALFFDALLKNTSMVIHGDGSQKRCFAFIDDSVEMTVRTIMSEKSIGEIVNIGNPDTEISILELARLAYLVSGGKGDPPIKFISHKEAYKTNKFEEIPRRIPDITKVIGITGYTPQIDNALGLEKTFIWQRALPQYQK